MKGRNEEAAPDVVAAGARPSGFSGDDCHRERLVAYGCLGRINSTLGTILRVPVGVRPFIHSIRNPTSLPATTTGSVTGVQRGVCALVHAFVAGNESTHVVASSRIFFADIGLPPIALDTTGSGVLQPDQGEGTGHPTLAIRKELGRKAISDLVTER